MELCAIKLSAEVSAVLRSESYVKCVGLTGNFSLTLNIYNSKQSNLHITLRCVWIKPFKTTGIFLKSPYI